MISENNTKIEDAIAAVREVIEDGKPWYRLSYLRAALDYLSDYARVVVERNEAYIRRAEMRRQLEDAYVERDAARAELAEAIASNEKAFKQNANQQREIERLGKWHDDEMLRVKACEHIAEGDEGWEKLRNECPSTEAVAKLRDAYERLRAPISDDTMEEARAIYLKWMKLNHLGDKIADGEQSLMEMYARALTAARERGKTQ